MYTDTLSLFSSRSITKTLERKTTNADLIWFHNFTCDIEVRAVVAEGGTCIQTTVCQLHSFDLKLPIADVCVFSIHYSHMVFGPVDSMKGVLAWATQFQTIPIIERV